MLNISVVVGNPKRESRTLRVARTLAEGICPPDQARLQVFDLALQADELFKWPSSSLSAISASVAGADLAIFACPTYKASYTGMMKAFLDRYPAAGLEGLPAICVMTGATEAHSMAPTLSLVPLLSELGAVPLSSVYFRTSDMGAMPGIVAGHAARIRQQLTRLARLGAQVTA